MKLLINTATTHKGGGVQVAYSFIQECIKHPHNQYVVVLGKQLKKLVDVDSFPKNFSFEFLLFRPAQKVISFQNQAKPLIEIAEKHNPDVVFTTSGPAYWKPSIPHLMGFNLPHFIYKDSPFFKKISKFKNLEWYLRGKIIKYYTKRDADAYVVQTDDVNHRLRKWIKSTKVYTITNTYGSQFETEANSKNLILPVKTSMDFRYLILTSYYKHKNLEILNPIIQNLRITNRKEIKFVLTLPAKDFTEVIEPENRGWILNVGPVKPIDCPQLYRECDAIFLPTLLECFSATYAEAMKMRLPILTVDLDFARTVCGKAAIYYSAVDSQEAFKKIIELSEDEELRKELILQAGSEMKKFNSAEERAEKYLAICQELYLSQETN